jgi:hypothetical protein
MISTAMMTVGMTTMMEFAIDVITVGVTTTVMMEVSTTVMIVGMTSTMEVDTTVLIVMLVGIGEMVMGMVHPPEDMVMDAPLPLFRTLLVKSARSAVIMPTNVGGVMRTGMMMMTLAVMKEVHMASTPTGILTKELLTTSLVS